MEWWCLIGLGLFVIGFGGKLFLASMQGKVNAQVRENPVANAVIQAVENVGRYDGFPESKRKAQSELDDEVRQIGSLEQNTVQLYWNTLEQENLYILLALWYSIAVGHYLKGMPSQFVDDLRYSAKTEGKDNAKGMAVFFPSYCNFVQRRHSAADYWVILGISSNFMNDYIQRKHSKLYSEAMMYQ